MAKKKGIVTILEDAAKEPAVKAMAASTAVAGGAIAGKLVHDRAERAQRREARRYRLDPRESTGAEIKRVVAGQLDNAIERLSADGAAESSDAIHDARKALKRGRTAVRLSRPLLGRRYYRQESRGLRDAGRQLAALRDSQVLLDTLDSLAPPSQFAGLRAALAVEGPTGEHNGQVHGQEVESALSELHAARARVDGWSLTDTGRPELLGQGLERIYRRGRRALRAAGREPNVENLHELRKRTKDLWHAAQLVRQRQPKRARALAGRAHALSDLLGEEHDLAVLAQRVGNQPAHLEPGERERLEKLIKRRRRHLRRQALSCAARLYRRKPRKVTKRLGLI